MIKHYTLGFVFDESYQRVILIKKVKNKFGHSGLWNGLGGRFENGETLLGSFQREVSEESGLHVSNSEHYATLSFDKMKVHVFRGTGIFPPSYTYKTEEGEIKSWYISDIYEFEYSYFVSNVKWLIEMALDFDPTRKFIEIVYE